MSDAPLRGLPRPSRLGRELGLKGKIADAASALGIETVGDLIEHLPREHADRRETTHTVRQHWLARFWMVPFNTGWHLAHHVDSGIPWRRLPELHEELVRSGYVHPELEHPSYVALWRKLASG